MKYLVLPENSGSQPPTKFRTWKKSNKNLFFNINVEGFREKSWRFNSCEGQF